mmetsp:Transcript_61646/g.137374  ORF Transcript_61646/g.137374 Transcript_61646/m.137374 type:complete len:324 (-) Transcript_61646:16-987(-)
MHELPPRLLLQVLLVLGVVAVEVPPQSAHHDHRDNAGKQEHDGERVDDREPVDLVIAHVKVEIPPRRPLGCGIFPFDVIRVDDLSRLAGLDGDGLRGEVGTDRDGEEGELLHVRGELALVLVLNRQRLDLKPNDTRAREGVLAVELDHKAQVVVDVGRAWDGPCAVGGTHEAHRVAAVVHGDRLAVRHLPNHLCCRRQVVHDHENAVVFRDALCEQLGRLLGQVGLTENFEVGLAHLDLVGRVLNDRAVQHFPQVLDRVRNLGRLAERQAVVVIRQLRLGRRQLVDLDLYLVTVSVLMRCHTGEIEGVGRRSEAQQQQALPCH